MSKSDQIIRILLVDDIAEVRENVKKLLAFEQDFEVVESTGSGMDGIRLAKELKPDIIIMDINMPDIDGISATRQINESLPATGVIMMSVNSDPDYMRQAMMAGARNFLTKPANMDELYNTIRRVYRDMAPIRDQAQLIESGVLMREAQQQLAADAQSQGEGDRAGNVIVVYSPKGGVGSTTIAVNMASGLMREDTKVLLIDADVQFGDISVFLNIQAQSTIVDILDEVDDFDVELFENIVVTHGSGLKVLLGPPRPEFAEQVFENYEAVGSLIRQVASYYDFVIVDTSSRLDNLTLTLFDLATRIMLVSTPTLSAVKSIRFLMDLFDQLEYPQEKVTLVLSKVVEEKSRNRVTIAPEKIENHLKRSILGSIPFDDRPILAAMNRGTPVIAAERDQTKSPVRELLDLANAMRAEFSDGDASDAAVEQSRGGGLLGSLGRLGR